MPIDRKCWDAEVSDAGDLALASVRVGRVALGRVEDSTDSRRPARRADVEGLLNALRANSKSQLDT